MTFDLATHLAHDKKWAKEKAKQMQKEAYENDDCPACSGTGEGAYDGQSCMHCGGSGISAPQLDYMTTEPLTPDQIRGRLRPVEEHQSEGI